MLASLALTHGAGASSVSRSFSKTSALSNESISVNLSVSVTGGETFYAIDDTYPSGWTVVNTSGDTSEARHVKFVVIQSASNTVHAYIIRTPFTPGNYTFSGVYMFENMTIESTVAGQSQVSVTSTDTTPPSITFVSPTPDNNTNVSVSYIYVNASLSEAAGTCLLSWYNGTWTNLTMSIVGSVCNRNMTGLANATYQFRIFATDLAGNPNASAIRQNRVAYYAVQGPYCQDGVCNSGETCSTCPQDCGSCTPPPSGPPPSGPSSPLPSSYTCHEEWQCDDWSACDNKTQSRVCRFVEVPEYVLSTKCPSLPSAPYTNQRCTPATSGKIANQCNDGLKNLDEEGVDCGGVCKPCTTENISTSNASSPSAGPEPEANDVQFEFMLKFVFYVVISFSMLLIIMFVFSKVRNRKHAPKKREKAAAKKTSEKAADAKPKPAMAEVAKEEPEKKEASKEETEKAGIARDEAAKRGMTEEPAKQEGKYDAVVSYVQELRANGMSDEYIKNTLLNVGWKGDVIDKILRDTKKL